MTDPDLAGLRAGSVLFETGRYRAAGTAWARSGDAGDPLVAGLASYATAVDHDGVVGRVAARLARDHLAVAPESTVDLAPVRAHLDGDAEEPPSVRVGGATPDVDALGLDTLARATAALAAVDETYDERVVRDAVRYARADVEAGRAGLATLLTDVVAGRAAGTAYHRLRARVDRRRAEERDVDGLFE